MGTAAEKQRLLKALQDFESFDSAPEDAKPDLGPEQLFALEWVATTGRNALPWKSFRRILLVRCERQLSSIAKKEGDAAQPFSDAVLRSKASLLRSISELEAPPFTLKRLCEILTTPVHSTPVKLLWALEKVAGVQYTSLPAEPFPVDDPEPIMEQETVGPLELEEEVISWKPIEAPVSPPRAGAMDVDTHSPAAAEPPSSPEQGSPSAAKTDEAEPAAATDQPPAEQPAGDDGAKPAE
eukprot:TRINITY_DN43395_c0_g1_i1.p1 TRINITY_DN43395_c0_g1~~TRINITY_DN43395_c0_g1_i1.p1  ORF type:complete len:258 (+),score=69.60 TRINITY_DN43395_c0_g1_i1:58-774(+)